MVWRRSLTKASAVRCSTLPLTDSSVSQATYTHAIQPTAESSSVYLLTTIPPKETSACIAATARPGSGLISPSTTYSHAKAGNNSPGRLSRRSASPRTIRPR